MYYCLFVKIENNHNRLRDDEIPGLAPQLPVVGKQFFMYGEGKEFGTRYVHTSEVESVEKTDDGILFKTASGSTYLLKDVRRHTNEMPNVVSAITPTLKSWRVRG